MNSVQAWAPANISCVFKPVIGKDPLHTGSMGLGFTINEGATVEVSFSDKTEIFFNDEEIVFPAVLDVIARSIATKESRQFKEDVGFKLNGIALPVGPLARNDAVNVKISIFSSLPLGCGFGISGASALASAYALNVLLNLKKKPLDLAKIAHCAEVESRTGLGDVINQYLGGCLLKLEPSYMFTGKRLPLEGIPIYCKVFGNLETKTVLSDMSMQKRIAQAADKAIRRVILASEERACPGSELIFPAEGRENNRDSGQARMTIFSDLIKISKQFALQSGLLKNKQVKETVSNIEKKGGFASMIMLGNAVISNIQFEGAREYNICSNKASIL